MKIFLSLATFFIIVARESENIVADGKHSKL